MRIAFGLCALILAIGAAAPPPPAAAQASPDATFTWSVPDRFGRDDDGDGLVDYPSMDESRNPPRFEVHLRVAERTCRLADATFRWRRDGADIAPARAADSCTFVTTVPAEGRYTFSLEVSRDGGTAESEQQVQIEDWLIVSIGDSVGSGDGNPERRRHGPAGWQDPRCHRSVHAGTAQAALALERDFETTTVTFMHLACSGARIDVGLLEPYRGISPIPALDPLPPQVSELQRIAAGPREIDAVLVSVGANDVHFSSVVKHCLWFPKCHETRFDPAQPFRRPRKSQEMDAVMTRALTELERSYDELADRIGDHVPAGRVFIVEYFDPTRGENGNFCRRANRIGHEELRWASEELLAPLNAAIAAAALRHQWTLVPGVQRAFATNGYCTRPPNRYVRTLRESIGYQGSPRDLSGTLSGAFHPNEAGHLATAGVIRRVLEPSLPHPGVAAAGTHVGGTWDDEPVVDDQRDILWLLVSLYVAAVSLAAVGFYRRRRGYPPLESEGWVRRHHGLLQLVSGAALVACALAVRDTIELSVVLAAGGALAIVLGPRLRD